MTNVYRQLYTQLPVQYLSIEVLFTLRLLFSDNDTELEQQVHALREHPTRLHMSYRDTWELHIKRALVLRLERSQAPTVSDFTAQLLQDITDLIEHSPHYAALSPRVFEAQRRNQVAASRQTKAHWRQQITGLLLPVSTLYTQQS